MKFVFTIRYGVALYGLILEAFYPFDSLPIDISDRVKESLKSQAQGVNYWSAIISLSSLTVIFSLSLMGLFTLIFCSPHLVMCYRPKFCEMMERRRAERALKNQTKQQPSKRAVWSKIAFSVLFSIAMILNDAIFNRPEDAASFKDGVVARLQYLGRETRFIIYAQIAIFSIFILFGAIFAVLRTMVYYRQQRAAAAAAAADEESGLAPHEVTEVEGKTFVLEEKLVDLSDGMDGIYEKMELYAAPDSQATNKEDEPLVTL